MNLLPNEVDRAVTDVARRFLDDCLQDSNLYDPETRVVVADEILPRIAELGWTDFPEDAGEDAGLTWVMRGSVMWSLGRTPLHTPVPQMLLGGSVHGMSSGMRPLTSQTSESGVVFVASDLLVQRCDSMPRWHGRVLEGGGRVLVEWGGMATHLVVSATDGTTPGVAIIDLNGPVSRTKVTMIDGGPALMVDVDGAGADWMVMDGKSFESLRSRLRLLRAAELGGIAERSLEITVEHVGARRQFGRPLAAHQAIQHRLADVVTLVEGARLAVAEGLSLADQQRACGPSAAVAAWSAGRAAAEAVRAASQFHGGAGFMLESPVGFFHRRARGVRSQLGSRTEQLEVLARTLLDPGSDRRPYLIDPREIP